MYTELLVVLMALVALTTGESFADWMTKDFCDRELAVGQVSSILLQSYSIRKILTSR